MSKPNTRYYTREYEKSCERLGNHFAQKYFKKVYEMWWVADDFTGILFINDFFFTPKDMYDYLKYHYTPEEMFERYNLENDYILENNKKEGFPCIRDWKKLCKNK